MFSALDVAQRLCIAYFLCSAYTTDMSSLNYTSYDGSIKSPEEMLALWQQVEIDIAETGQSYNSPGGVEVTLADLEMVQKQVKFYEKKVLRRRGLAGRNIADLTGGNDNRNTL